MLVAGSAERLIRSHPLSRAHAALMACRRSRPLAQFVVQVARSTRRARFDTISQLLSVSTSGPVPVNVECAFPGRSENYCGVVHTGVSTQLQYIISRNLRRVCASKQRQNVRPRETRSPTLYLGAYRQTSPILHVHLLCVIRVDRFTRRSRCLRSLSKSNSCATYTHTFHCHTNTYSSTRDKGRSLFPRGARGA